MENIKIRGFSVLLLFLPLNIYIIGDYLGAGIQFSLFRFQVTYLGDGFITIFQDLNYINNGTFNGKTAFSVGFWIIGTILLLISIAAIWIKKEEKYTRIPYAGILIIISGVFYLSSIIIQYGPLFHSPAGISIPIGIPIFLVLGIWIYLTGIRNDTTQVRWDDSRK